MHSITVVWSKPRLAIIDTTAIIRIIYLLTWKVFFLSASFIDRRRSIYWPWKMFLLFSQPSHLQHTEVKWRCWYFQSKTLYWLHFSPVMSFFGLDSKIGPICKHYFTDESPCARQQRFQKKKKLHNKSKFFFSFEMLWWSQLFLHMW